MADRRAVAGTVQFVEPMQHELQEVYTGFPKAARRPAFGAVVSRTRGAGGAVPRYVSLDQYYADHGEVENPQYAGAAHRPFLFGGEGIRNLGLKKGMTADRLGGRRRPSAAFDSPRRDHDARPQEAAAMAEFTARAAEMVTSPKAREAFDLSREPDRVRRRYGEPGARYTYGNDPKPTNPWPADKFLLARRLVEAGVSVVTLRVGTW